MVPSGKTALVAIAAMAMTNGLAAPSFEEDEYAVEFDRAYAGVRAEVALPQGGSKMSRKSGAAASFGFWLDEFIAADFAVSVCERETALSGGILWLWWGYERLDPFFTLGLRDWIDEECGPYAGCGCYWHIDDHWSVRFDASAMYGLENQSRWVHSLSLGIERSF